MSGRNTSGNAITRFERVVLAYGAACGFLLLLFASGNPVLAVLMGIPPGLFGMGVVLLIRKYLGFSQQSFSSLPQPKRRQIGLVVLLTFAAMLGSDVLAGNWLDFGCAAMMAGAFFLFILNDLGYFAESDAAKPEVS